VDAIFTNLQEQVIIRITMVHSCKCGENEKKNYKKRVLVSKENVFLWQLRNWNKNNFVWNTNWVKLPPWKTLQSCFLKHQSFLSSDKGPMLKTLPLHSNLLTLIDPFSLLILFPNTDHVMIPRRLEPLSYSMGIITWSVLGKYNWQTKRVYLIVIC